jgi:hypothetical protein
LRYLTIMYQLLWLLGMEYYAWRIANEEWHITASARGELRKTQAISPNSQWQSEPSISGM